MLFVFDPFGLSFNQSHRTKSRWNCRTTAIVTAVLATFTVQQVTAMEAGLVDLSVTQIAGAHQQVRVVLEIEGQLNLNPDGKEVTHLPVKGQADLSYVERTLSVSQNPAHTTSIRHYAQAEAHLKMRDTELNHLLRDERKLIGVAGSSSRATLYSPLGPLTRDELELVEAPASGLALAALLPNRTLKVGADWKLDDDVVSRLLNLEAISQQSIVLTLDSVKEGVAISSIEGKVAGAVGGVSSDIEVKGKLNYDLRRRAVTWLALGYKESRAIGHAQPGYDISAKLRMVAAPCQSTSEVADKALTGLRTTGEDGQSLMEYSADSAGFGLAHDRRWHVMVDRHDLTVLRFVDRGDLIGQCNISPRPELGKAQQLTLEGFQQDVKQALGENFGQVVEAGQEAAEGGLTVQRVVVSGTAGDLPIQWTYYHLFNQAGRRAALVFTIEGSLIERFGQIDRELLSGFHFIDGKQPTPAEKAEERTVERPTPVSTK
jgi:hypothetical protein